MSGGSSKSQIVGYKYHLGVMIAVCHGPVDAVTGFICGDRTAWSGTQAVTGEITINRPALFGGDQREGGLVGIMKIMMGDATQGRDGYLASRQGANCPAYRRILTVLFKPSTWLVFNKPFQWSSGNPYFKSPWIRVRRLLAGWNTPVFDSARVRIDTDANGTSYDMNPAHIVYQAFTDPEWGMGYSVDDIDSDSFLAASQQLYSEKFGLSIKWDEQGQIKAFVQDVVNHINGLIRLNLSTGKLMLKLIRDDYDVGTLTSLNESNIISMKSFERIAYGDFANELVVTYTSRDGDNKTIQVQDLASIQAQGTVISTSKNYPGVRNVELAARIALRDLALLSTPLSKLSVTTNRILWDKEVGDVVKFSWADLGLIDIPYRIISVDKGNLTKGEISAELVEDVFGLPDGTYTQLQDPMWTDTTNYPQNVEAARALESPYWEVVRNMSAADFDYLEPEYGFGMLLAARGITNTPFHYIMRAASASSGPYETVATLEFNPTGLLVNTISPTQTTFTIEDFYDLYGVVLDEDNGYALIDDEMMAVVSVDGDTGAVVVRRSVLDTVPKHHNAGARIFFVLPGGNGDPTSRTESEITYYKALSVTGLGTLDESSASAFSVTFANRASRPYPPGNFQISGAYFPASLSGSISASWAHRDRVQQTVSLIDFTQGSVGPEAGTTYNLYIYSGVTLKRSYLGITGTTWTYPAVDEIADGYIRDLRIVLNSQVGAVTSLQQHDHTVTRYGLGFSLGQSLGGIAI